MKPETSAQYAADAGKPPQNPMYCHAATEPGAAHGFINGVCSRCGKSSWNIGAELREYLATEKPKDGEHRIHGPECTTPTKVRQCIHRAAVLIIGGFAAAENKRNPEFIQEASRIIEEELGKVFTWTVEIGSTPSAPRRLRQDGECPRCGSTDVNSFVPNDPNLVRCSNCRHEFCEINERERAAQFDDAGLVLAAKASGAES